MGIVDMLSSEDRVQVKFSDFYSLMKEATKAEFLMNGIKTGVDHSSMYSMATGEPYEVTTCTCDSCVIPGISDSNKEEKEDEQ